VGRFPIPRHVVGGVEEVPVSRTLGGAHTCADPLDGRYDSGVSQPEIQRQVRQQRADIDALYELVERVDQKVDAVDVKLDRRFDEISGQLSEVLRQLGGR
jgi:hypothetical protein